MQTMVSRDTFESADQETKYLLIYDILTSQNALLAKHVEAQKLLCERRCSACDTRMLKIERRKLAHMGIAAAGGFIGGYIAMIVKLTFWDK